MELFIRIVDGKPVNHPIVKENLLMAFPDVDLDTTSDFMLFERVAMPQLEKYQVHVGTTYELIDGVYKDVHEVRDMTQEEKDAKDAAFAAWLEANPPTVEIPVSRV
jgi:hypothetical protein